MCVSKNKINMIPVIVFMCSAFAGVICSQILDKISRRTAHFIFSTGHVTASTIIIFTSTYSGRAFGFALMGLMTAKNITCYTWLFEIMVKENKSWANTSINVLDFSTLIIGGIYL